MTSYEDYADQTEKLTVGFTDDHRAPVVEADLQHIRNLVATLKIHHRGTRSINILRTTSKVIAGTPDFDDWEQKKFNQEQLSRTEKIQNELNIKFQDRLNGQPTR